MDLAFLIVAITLSGALAMCLRLWRANVSLRRTTRELESRATVELHGCQDDLAEAKRRQADAMAILDTAPAALAAFDTNGQISYIHPRLRELLEAPDEATDVWGLFESGTEEIGQFIMAALANGPLSFQGRLASRWGGRLLTVTLFPRPGGTAGLVATFEDVVDRRVTEERLRRAQAMTTAILDAAVDGIVTTDERGRIETFNKAAEKAFGYRADEVKGASLNILMPSRYRPHHDHYIRSYLVSGRPKIIGVGGREVEGQRKDGSVFPMELAVGESTVAGRRIFAGILRDITHRRAVELQLRDSEERFRLLVEGVRDYAISILDADGRILSWNRGGEAANGWSAEDIIGRHFSCFYPPEAVAGGAPERAMAMLREHGRFAEEGWRLRKDGTPFWAHVVLSAIHDSDGNLRGITRISRDMSRQKHTADDLRRAREEADKAREEAERANKAKSKFLAAASHDLRQPVQALLFFASALAERLADHPVKEMVHDMQQSVEALNLLLGSLLDISRLDAGVVQPSLSSFPVANLLDRLQSEFLPLAAAKGLSLTVKPCGGMVHSDPALLGRIIQNLMSNAIRYTDQGRVLVGCRRHGDSLRIGVWDTGPGIPEERVNEIFQEFVQLSNSSRDRNQGLGLGLAIVDRLARLLGHRLTLRTSVGKGSLFAIDVPLAKEQSAGVFPPETCPAGPDEQSQRRMIVVIDDEAAILKGLRMVLESWDYEVLAAGSEEEAMSLLERYDQRPHAILADYRLRNGRTGTQAVERIRSHFDAPIPSIIITGDTAPERLREAETSGLQILHKPVQAGLLRRLLTGQMQSGSQPIRVKKWGVKPVG